jgi:hypothetical protein
MGPAADQRRLLLHPRQFLSNGVENIQVIATFFQIRDKAHAPSGHVWLVPRERIALDTVKSFE